MYLISSVSLPSWCRLKGLLFGLAVLLLSGCQLLMPTSVKEPYEVADSTDAESAYREALILDRTGRKADLYKANVLLAYSAERGHTGAQYLLGMNRLLGRGGDKEPTAARALLTQAAESGHASAQYFLAEMMLNGRGGESELAWGAQWMERAAANGQVEAQLAMGVIYASGLGGRENIPMALLWLSRAEHNGDQTAPLLIQKLSARVDKPRWQAVQRQIAGRISIDPREARRAITRFVQLSLNNAGYAAGVEDGIAGPRTRAAVAAFRNAKKLTGQGIDDPLLSQLRSSQLAYEQQAK
ncbi:peptidoglycan-binding protein [Motiliproteus coralliicola]|uniref:peptidoglycan-binding protein n=1 Tax=Motiliproteus coralliicola TaxID=2283196 RepID=UPI000E0994C8|nr:peptidoglycan-binding protein [Motiliproteus coralliicola]